MNTLLCRAPQAEKLAQRIRVTVAASPPSAKLFEDMIALNLIPVHVYGLVGVDYYYSKIMIVTDSSCLDRNVSFSLLK